MECNAGRDFARDRAPRRLRKRSAHRPSKTGCRNRADWAFAPGGKEPLGNRRERPWQTARYRMCQTAHTMRSWLLRQKELPIAQARSQELYAGRENDRRTFLTCSQFITRLVLGVTAGRLPLAVRETLAAWSAISVRPRLIHSIGRSLTVISIALFDGHHDLRRLRVGAARAGDGEHERILPLDFAGSRRSACAQGKHRAQRDSQNQSQ